MRLTSDVIGAFTLLWCMSMTKSMHFRSERGPSAFTHPIVPQLGVSGELGRQQRKTLLLATSNSAAKSKTVGKVEICTEVSAECGVSKKDVAKVIDSLPSVVTRLLSQRDKVSFGKIGSFGSKLRPARTARNPRTNEAVAVKASVVPTFSFCKTMKTLMKDLNGSKPSEPAIADSDKKSETADANGFFRWR